MTHTEYIMRSVLIFSLNICALVKGFKILNGEIYRQTGCSANKFPMDVHTVHVRALADCVLVCNNEPDCSGIYHSDNTQKCALETADTINDHTKFLEDTTAMLYRKLSFALPTPLTPVTAHNCPSKLREDVNLIGTSGTNYPLKVSRLEKTFDEAHEYCCRRGMQMLTVNSKEKIEDISGFLTNCPAYRGYDYWTDAKRYVNETGQPWKNSNGDVIKSVVWYHQIFGHDVNEYCGRLREYSGYFLADNNCNTKYRFICE